MRKKNPRCFLFKTFFNRTIWVKKNNIFYTRHNYQKYSNTLTSPHLHYVYVCAYFKYKFGITKAQILKRGLYAIAHECAAKRFL